MISFLNNNDYFCVYNDYSRYNYSKELNLLYLPLVGSNAIKLYDFLFAKIVEEGSNMSRNKMHYDIIDNLSITSKEILFARKKLEAIGLLKVYFLEKDNKKQYVYKILRPLLFEEFFVDPLLSTLLENKIGYDTYNYIYTQYRNDKVSFSTFKDVTAKFTDVYTYDNLNDYSFENIVVKKDVGPNLDEYFFEFDKLNYLLSNKYLDNILDNHKIKNDILSLAHLYKATPNDMAKGIERSVTNVNGDSIIDIDILKEYLIQLYINIRKQEIPILDNMVKKQLVKETYTSEVELTEEEKFSKKLDNLTYLEFLNKRHGLKVSAIDAKNIAKLQEKYNFTKGVLNILLDYSLKNSSDRGIPSFNYMDKIASSWSNKKMVSAYDAIQYIKTIIKSYQVSKYKSSKAKNTYKNYNNTDKKASIPEYIENQIDEIKTGIKSNENIEEDLTSYNALMELVDKEKEGN